MRSGERFFDVLKQMCGNPGKYLPVIKLMYLCMSLGFIGQYRLSRRGVGDINRIREETYAVIARQQKAAEPDLAPHTKGIDAPYRPARFRVPLWVAASAGLGIVAALFLWFSVGLNATSDDLYARLQTAPPSRMPTITRTPVVEPAPAPTPALPPEPTVLDRLRKFLQPEIEQGLVEVTGTVGQPLVRITGRGMFPSGSATVNPSFKPLAGSHRAGVEGGARFGQGHRLYRRPADPHHRLPVEFPALDGAREGSRHDHRRQHRRCLAAERGGKGGRRPDRDQLHAGGS